MAAERETIRATVDDEDQIFGLPTECRDPLLWLELSGKFMQRVIAGARHKHQGHLQRVLLESDGSLATNDRAWSSSHPDRIVKDLPPVFS